MGLQGAYTVEMRCDDHKHKVNTRGHATFYGETLRECLKIARQLGWKYNSRNGHTLCPTCGRRRLFTVRKGGRP